MFWELILFCFPAHKSIVWSCLLLLKSLVTITEERMTQAWVTADRIFIIGWFIPLRFGSDFEQLYKQLSVWHRTGKKQRWEKTRKTLQPSRRCVCVCVCVNVWASEDEDNLAKAQEGSWTLWWSSSYTTVHKELRRQRERDRETERGKMPPEVESNELHLLALL